MGQGRYPATLSCWVVFLFLFPRLLPLLNRASWLIREKEHLPQRPECVPAWQHARFTGVAAHRAGLVGGGVREAAAVGESWLAALLVCGGIIPLGALGA